MKRTENTGKYIINLAVSVVAAVAFCCIFWCINPGIELLADDEASIYLTSESSDNISNPGDIVTISVCASDLRNITRFGTIRLLYDDSKVDYLSVYQPTNLSAFSYTIDSTEIGVVSVSAVNERVEADIDQALLHGGEFDDNSFSAAGEVQLFSVSFRVLANSNEAAVFTLDDIGTFTNSSREDVDISVTNGTITEVISEEPSSDAHIAFLTVTGYTLTPEFSSDVTDYTLSVSRDVQAIQLSAIPVNLWATVEIFGNSNLQEGDNLITINVSAQDGITTNTYSIHVFKQENYLTEGAGLLDALGNSYTFVAFPQDIVMPEGFIATNKTINGYSVPVYARDGVESVLVYMSNGSESPSFYFYNPSLKTVIPYEPVRTVVVSSRILFKTAIPDSLKIPEEFTASTLYIKGREIDGYVNKDGDFICYMVDESGIGGLYRYIVELDTFVEYHTVNRNGSSMYRFLYHLFLFLTAVEAIIIVIIVFIVRQNITKRKTPRPRRV